MTLLRDLIDIPDRVHKGDFVLKLTEGVLDPQATLHDYVVTDGLAKAFDQALQLIESAVSSRASKATYLHGSFGSGKSHFMAVLYLLMRQEPAARAIPELAAVVDRHDTWLQGKRFLLVPFHLIGALNLPSAVLGGYAEHLRRLHPEAPGPAVYLADSILDNAEQLRQQMGDDAFFAALAQTSDAGAPAADSGWGDLASGWDAVTYDQARQATPQSDDQRSLVRDLLAAFFSAYGVQADSTGAGFVSMDAGLAEISRHAAELGYQGVVLFLDELILWLASRAGAATFVEQQIESLVKLVEAERADRPIPIVSFLARQRDLRKLIGDHMPGAERLRYVDKLDHYEGRFGKIVLEDRDLAKIVEKRILRPKSDDARQRLDEAFETSLRTQPQVVDTLMANRDRATFRAVYPFSPALVDGLVAVSSVLQRERTALKLLSELLVSRREALEVGDLVPVGDLWDVLVAGDEPFTEEMRIVFEQAKKLWRSKLRPMLEDQHNLAPGHTPPLGHAFHGDARLLKTVLLAALAPEAPELRGLNVSRLVALNHGSIRSPIPGQETQLAAGKLRDWVARGAGEIHLGEGTNPSIALELTGVDVDSILERVRGEDNQGNRARKVRELMFQAMAISDDDRLFFSREVRWRGTQRTLDVVFGNVRDLAADTFTANGERWRLVLDFPFDSEGFTPADDLARLEVLRQEMPRQRTFCWLPSFFSRKGQGELGRLVLIDFLLAGERFDHNASHLPASDRQSARALLKNQQTQLRERIRQALASAFGLRDGHDALIDHGLELDQHLQSLEPTFEPRLPPAATFKEALEQLAYQALEHQFPAHPNLGLDLVRKADVAKVLQLVTAAIEDPDRRLRLEDKKQRLLLSQIAGPLRLGEMHEAHFQLSEHWISHFEKEAARHEGPMTVGALRQWFDRPREMGLPGELQDLVIQVFAARTHRTFLQYGGPLVPTPGQDLQDHWVLEARAMPSAEEWAQACALASSLFGVQPLSSLLTANNVADLEGKLRHAADAVRPHCQSLVKSLLRRCESLGSDGGERLTTARNALRLLEQIERADGAVMTLRRVAKFVPVPSAKAVARTMEKAAEVLGRLDDEELWQLIASTERLQDAQRQAEAAALRRRLVTTLEHHELSMGLADSLDKLRAEVLSLLTSNPAPSPATPSPATVVPATVAQATAAAPAVAASTAAAQTAPSPGWQQTEQGGGQYDDRSAIEAAIVELRRAALQAGEGKRRLELRWSLWQPEDEG